MNVSNPTTTRPTETTLPMDTYDMMIKVVDELNERAEKAEKEEKAGKLYIKTLKEENITLKNNNNKLESEKIGNETLIQLIDENLQTSNRVLQCACAVAGAILGGSLVLAFPVIAAPAIALAGTGPAAAGVAVAGGAGGGAVGGCLVAPVIHKKMNNALIQQVQTFKAKEEISKKVK